MRIHLVIVVPHESEHRTAGDTDGTLGAARIRAKNPKSVSRVLQRFSNN